MKLDRRISATAGLSLTVMLATASEPEWPKYSLHIIGEVPGNNLVATGVTDMNEHGVVIGRAGQLNGFRWSVEDGTDRLDTMNLPTSINNAGVIVGRARISGVPTAATWTRHSGVQALPFSETTPHVEIASYINDSGFIVGQGTETWSDAVVWAPGLLPAVLAKQDGRANPRFISESGFIGGGFEGRAGVPDGACTWTSPFTFTLLSDGVGCSDSLLEAINTHGIAIGHVCNGNQTRAATWSLATGWQPLPDLTDGFRPRFGISINDLGDIIAISSNPDDTALYIEGLGGRRLGDLTDASGTGYQFRGGVINNARWIALAVYPDGAPDETRAAVLRPPCNQFDLASLYGKLDIDDVLAMLDLFSSSSPDTDFDANGLVNIDDLLIFLDAFIDGCPSDPFDS